MRFLLAVGYVTEIVKGLRAAAFWRGVFTNAAIAVVPALRNRLLMNAQRAAVLWLGVYTNAAIAVFLALSNRLLMYYISSIVFKKVIMPMMIVGISARC